MNRLFVTGAVMAISLLSSSVKAAPVVSIELAETGFAPLVVSSGSGDASFNGSYGTYDVNITTGTGQPLLPATQGVGLSSLNITTTATGSLTLGVTETDLTSASPSASFSGSISGTLSGAITSLVYSSYADNTDTPFGAQQQLGLPDTFTASPFSGSVNGTATGLAGLYSLTETVVVTTTPGTALFSFNARLAPTATPEPASLALLGTGVLGYGLARRRRTPPGQTRVPNPRRMGCRATHQSPGPSPYAG